MQVEELRENSQENMAPRVEEEVPRQLMPRKPLMLDKATDTSLDEESFKVVPCTCRLADADSDFSITEHITPFGYKPSATLRECLCK